MQNKSIRPALTLRQRVGDLLFPPTCVGCGTLLPPLDVKRSIFCPACTALSEAGLSEDSVTFSHGPCTVHINLYDYHPGHTNGVPEKLIYHIKHKGDGRVFDAIGRMLRSPVTTVWQVTNPTVCPSEVVWAYPPRRLSSRCKDGFDQAKRLAQALASACGGQCLPLLRRTGDRTKEQKHLNAADRRENMTHAFTLFRRLAARVKGHPVMLVDDVCTTGATLTACTHLLLGAGASCVMWVTVAKTKE